MDKKGLKHQTPNLEYRSIVKEIPLAVASECYRKIKVTLDFTNVDKKIQVIQFTSAIQGEGKSTTALNVAYTYLEDGLKVLIVDLDLRRPKIHRNFKAKNEHGLTDYLAGNISLEECIKHSDTKLDYINSGSKVPSPISILNSNTIEDLFSKLREMYDIIIIDATPCLMVSDSIVASRLSDGTILVINESVSEKALCKQTVKQLKANGVNILGVVYNGTTKKSSGSSDYSYKYMHKYN